MDMIPQNPQNHYCFLFFSKSLQKGMNCIQLYTKIEEINTNKKECSSMENTLKEARTIQNLHSLIKNNGKDFNLTEEQLKLAEMLS